MQQTAKVVQTQSQSKLKSIALTLLLCLGVTLVIFGLFFGMLRYFNVFPFSKSCVSQYDLAVQIVPFAEHFFDVVKGDASLFYSYRLAGGMDVFGAGSSHSCYSSVPGKSRKPQIPPKAT